jgi:hypothetical protein
MKNKIVLVTIFSLAFPVIVLAATQNPCVNATPDLGRCVGQVYIWAMGAAAVLALFMIVFGGYMTMTAAGNAERASRGRSFITSSLLGLLLLFGAYLLLNQINPDLTNFNFDINNYLKQDSKK